MSIANWEAMKICYHAQKKYVSQSDLNSIKEYEDGDVERVCVSCAVGGAPALRTIPETVRS
jgi:hypothetical protein